jgi:hypothetical protein
VDESIADRHLKQGHTIHEFEVRQTTLDDICAEHGVTTIHFLKVDVEGHEAKVLAGMAFTEYRPWVAVVEATAPNSQVETHDAWEPRLLAHGYVFVYADGLNRFYLAQEKYEELKHAFRYPPNFFDDFERMSVHWLRHHAARLQGDLDALENERDKWLIRGNAASPGLEHDMLVALRTRYRRVRAESVLLRRQLRDQQAESKRMRDEHGDLLEAGRAARRYRMQLFAAEEQLVDKVARVDAQLREIENLREYVAALENQAAGLDAQRVDALAQAGHWKEQTETLLRSSSWRLMRPFRVARRLWSNPAAHGGRREAARRISGVALRLATKVPGARRYGGALLRRLPRMRDRLLRLHGVPSGTEQAIGVTSSGPASLSPVADMYAQALRGAHGRATRHGKGTK